MFILDPPLDGSPNPELKTTGLDDDNGVHEIGSITVGGG